MRTVAAWLVVAGTFLPVLAAGITVLLARGLRGGRRWAALGLVPGAGGGLMFAVAPPVMENGNLLAAVLFLLYWVALALYYPALLVTAGLVLRQRRARDR